MFFYSHTCILTYFFIFLTVTHAEQWTDTDTETVFQPSYISQSNPGRETVSKSKRPFQYIWNRQKHLTLNMPLYVTFTKCCISSPSLHVWCVISKLSHSDENVTLKRKCDSIRLTTERYEIGVTQELVSSREIGVTQELVSSREIGVTQELVSSREIGVTQELVSSREIGVTQELVSSKEIGVTQELVSSREIGVTQELVSWVFKGNWCYKRASLFKGNWCDTRTSLFNGNWCDTRTSLFNGNWCDTRTSLFKGIGLSRTWHKN